jgi:hypothetical protein
MKRARAVRAAPLTLQPGECVQEINLSWNPLRPKGGIAIAKGVAPHPRLQVLDLSWCGLGDEGASALGPCCQVNQVCVCVCAWLLSSYLNSFCMRDSRSNWVASPYCTI